MTFLNPLDALIPKISFSFFADFSIWVTSEARGSVSVGFRGSRQLSPLIWGGGGVRPEGSIDPSPFDCKPGCPCSVVERSGLGLSTLRRGGSGVGRRRTLPGRLPRGVCTALAPEGSP